MGKWRLFCAVSKSHRLHRGDATVWEREPLEKLAMENYMGAYQHDDFWHPMDTLRDKNHLEAMWASGNAPWKIWEPIRMTTKTPELV